MDGRRLRLWLCGGIVLGALGCHKQQTLPGGVSLPSPGQPVAAKSSPSLFTPSTTPMPATPATNAADLAVAPKPSSGKKGSAPDFDVSIGDLRVSYADTDNLSQTDRERLIDSAREAYQTALKKDPKHKGAMLGLARLYARLGDTAKADEMYRQYMTANPKDHATLHEVAMAHAKAKDFAGAAAWCQAALKVDPENRGYRKTLGFCLVHAGKWEEGFASLCDVMPEAEARYTMARALTTLNQPEMGKQQLALAIQADPKFTPARELLAEMQNAPPQGVESQPSVQAVQYQQPMP